MSDSSKKQTFLHGTALLALSTAIVKVIGAFYSIPLKGIIGDQGFGYYSTAYEIHTLLLLISAFVKGDWQRIYDFALANGFRFLSYGDSSVLFRR